MYVPEFTMPLADWYDSASITGKAVSGSMTMKSRFQPECTELTRKNCEPAASERPLMVMSR